MDKYVTEAVETQMCDSALQGVKFPGEGRGKMRETVSTLGTLITHSFKLHLDN